MKVSRLLTLIIAVFAALCFAFTPLIAGDHPWNEDENPNGGGVPDNGGSNPDDPNVTNPDETDELFGSSLWWWELIWDGVIGEDGTDGSPTGSAPSTDSETSSDQLGDSVQ